MRIVLDIDLKDPVDVKQAWHLLNDAINSISAREQGGEKERAQVLEPLPKPDVTITAAQVNARPIELTGRDVQPEPQPAAAPVKPPVSEDIVKAVRVYAQANGFTKTRELLGKFGAARASDIAPEKYAEFLEAARQSEQK